MKKIFLVSCITTIVVFSSVSAASQNNNEFTDKNTSSKLSINKQISQFNSSNNASDSSTQGDIVLRACSPFPFCKDN